MTVSRRGNQALLEWLRAAAIAGVTFAATSAGNVQPAWAPAGLALVAGVLTLLAVDLGMLAALAALSLPIAASNAVVGVAFLVLAVVSVKYLGSDGGRVFFIIAAAVICSTISPLFPVWAVVGIAGVLMGAGEGAVTAALACFIVQAWGLLIGNPVLGPTVTGGSELTAVLEIGAPAASLVSPKWLAASFGAVGPDTVNMTVGALGKATNGVALVLQPLAWGAGAAVAGMLSTSPLFRRGPLKWSVAPAAGVLTTAAATLLLATTLSLPIDTSLVLAAGVSSAIVAVAVVVALEMLFPRLKAAHAPIATNTSMAAEDADVDELLRLIATAEDKLTAEHTTQRTVLITDMKSFSRMTEEDGSMLSAKAVQKHRDLLLPIIASHNGHGKSTGGDGLVAAFEDPACAILAAADMQRAIARHNENHPDEREMSVRVGIAEGEVVLDRGGRPFIGSALNLAARVMNLADGAQVFVTGTVAGKASVAIRSHSHGAFELKNIAKPVDITEVLWAENQQPVDPRTRTVA